MIQSRTLLRVRSSLIICLCLLVMSAACLRSKGVLKGNDFRTGETEYEISEIPKSWERISLPGADLAYVHREDGSTLLVNSNCKKVEDAPLIALTYHLIIGMTEQKIIDQRAIAIADREGLETTAEVKIDGVKRKLKLFVLKKDRCVYDIVLSASPQKFDDALSIYESTLKGFKVVGVTK